LKAELGYELTPTQVKDQPSVRWNAEPYSFYTLCLTGVYIAKLIAIYKSVDDFFFTVIYSDPDAGKLKEFHHWLVGNIPGADVSVGETLTAYVGSATPPKTGNYLINILYNRDIY